jgi:hypothetical protein
MADATFKEVFNWLVDHKGQKVYIEVGCRDPAIAERADFAAIGLHTTLGDVRTVEDKTHGRRALRVLVANDDRSGIEVDEARVTSAKIHGPGLKVWQEGVYIGVTCGSA